MKFLLKLLFSFLLLFFALNSYSQQQIIDKIAQGEIHGNFQSDLQYYKEDSLIGAPFVPEKVLMNGFANLIYTNGPFNAGIRYESYLNALQGFDKRYEGNGIPYRYFTFQKEKIEVTAGNYYEQFGSGIIFRTYEERNLGYDNAMDGFRIKAQPLKGLYLKGVIGKQRLYFSQGPGIVRGFDGELVFNELNEKFSAMKSTVILGGSFVSKYQKDQDPLYNLPENVGAFAGRLNITSGKFNVFGEYAYKINDPSAVNKLIYKPGEAIYVSTSYSQKGLGISLSAKRIDNMNFRSDRNATLNDLLINYLPALTRQHTYNLAATLYPYATQLNGEIALQGDLIYTFKKDTRLGGKYGTLITVNISAVNNLDTTHVNDMEGKRQYYKADYLSRGEKYFRDFNIDITKKLSNKIKSTVAYVYMEYNKDVIIKPGNYGIIYSHIGIVDVAYKLNPNNTLRTEFQHLYTQKDNGSWATAIMEYTYAPHWFVAAMDQYNYGNTTAEKRIHYLLGSVGYIHNATRVTLSYGRQREGIFCVGGVCRNVPASNGITLSITSSF